jgi:hypothetical protein
MSEQTVERIEEETFTHDVSDDALEMVGGGERNPTHLQQTLGCCTR